MTQTEALRLALEALENIDRAMPFPVGKQAITAIKAALEAKDEPVAWWIPKHKAPDMVSKVRWSDECEPLYTTPPQRKPLTIEQPKVRTGDCLLVGVCASEGHKIQPRRTWVKLTDSEIGTIAYNVNPLDGVRTFARAIEAKLKEKNT